MSHIPNFFYQLISKFNKEIPAISAGEININTKSGIDWKVSYHQRHWMNAYIICTFVAYSIHSRLNSWREGSKHTCYLFQSYVFSFCLEWKVWLFPKDKQILCIMAIAIMGFESQIELLIINEMKGTVGHTHSALQVLGVTWIIRGWRIHGHTCSGQNV